MLVMPVIALAQQNGIGSRTPGRERRCRAAPARSISTIIDDGAADRLTAQLAGGCEAELHESFTENGVSPRCARSGRCPWSRQQVTLAPDGYHIMLTGLKQPLNQDDAFPVTLNFEKAGPVTATVTVQKAGAACRWVTTRWAA